MKRRKLQVVGGAFLLTVILAFWLLRLILSESEYPERRSLSWYVLMSSSIVGELALPNLIGEPVYYYSAGDGPKQPECSVTFTTSGKPEVVRQEIESFLSSNGYIKSSEGFEKAGRLVDMTIEERDELSVVTVRESP